MPRAHKYRLLFSTFWLSQSIAPRLSPFQGKRDGRLWS
ncbi:hypothetical protein IB211_03317 [Intestinimonas butyriciproducens]|uniref:Uncharacterized protein n=1 Tax=Intestinimonas butyriciproducens TaxID=1297617 RepID=A0A0S2W8P9_9FIRM|nr:hypothetical protein IB211_03317 [Intestinimonas butyriciproducens]